MRFDTPTLLHLALVALPVTVALLGLGVFAALVATLLVVGAGIVLRSRAILSPPDASLLELHTITYSHYVEKVRWCLDATGIAYREVPSIGILGLLLTGRTVPLLVHPASRTEVGDSPQILRFLWGNWSAVLSRERIGFLEPTPEALALERHFDVDLGIPIRKWSYWHLLRQKDLTLKMWGIDEHAIPQWQRKALPLLEPLLAAILGRVLGVSDGGAADALLRFRAVFAEVDAMLSDGRRYLLATPGKTFVDITFASLAALALFPEGYGGRDARHRSVPLDALAPEWRAAVEALRATPAGQFVMRMYAEERYA